MCKHCMAHNEETDFPFKDRRRTPKIMDALATYEATQRADEGTREAVLKGFSLLDLLEIGMLFAHAGSGNEYKLVLSYYSDFYAFSPEHTFEQDNMLGDLGLNRKEPEVVSLKPAQPAQLASGRTVKYGLSQDKRLLVLHLPDNAG